MESSRSLIKTLIELWVYDRKEISAVIIYGLVVGIMSLVTPMAVQSLVNSVAFTTLLQPVAILTIVVFVLLGMASLMRLFQVFIVELLQKRVLARIALELSYRLPRIKTEVFEKEKGPDLVNRFFEIQSIQKNFSIILLDGISVFLQTIIGMIVLAFYHPYLLVFDIILILLILWVIRAPFQEGLRTSLKESKVKYNIAAWLEEISRHTALFKLTNGKKFAIQKTDQLVNDYITERGNHFKILIKQIASLLTIQIFCSAILLGVGSYLVINKQLTLGQLVASELILTVIVSGMSKIGKYIEAFYDLLTATDKLNHLFELPLERTKGEKLELEQLEKFELELRNVSYSHSNERPIVDNLSIKIRSGERVAIWGINGSGKSTLIDILISFKHPSRGAVLVNGIPLNQIDLEEYRSQIAIIRKVEIFEGTILDNLKLGRDDISTENLRDALEQVCLLDEILKLPDGLLTVLSGSLSILSAGQLQKLMLARAIAHRPKLIILDEALESIDENSKDVVLKNLISKNNSWALIVTGHEIREFELFDRIYNITEGKIKIIKEDKNGI